MRSYFLFFLCCISNYLFAQTISFEKYFPLKKGAIQHYNVSHIYKTDTINDKVNISVCQSAIVKGKEIYYFDENVNNDDTAIISSQSFCAGVFYYFKGVFMFSPISWKYEIKDANLHYFEPLFPAKISLNTPYRYQYGEEKRKYLFTKFENVVIRDKMYKDCLKLIVTQDWTTTRYTDTVWFQKGLGVVKWLRSTGRLEELKQ